MQALADVGIDMDDVVVVLEDEAVEKFETSWNELLESTKAELERLGAADAGSSVTVQVADEGGATLDGLGRSAGRARTPRCGAPRREPEAEHRLGWLDLPQTSQELLPQLRELRERLATQGLDHVVLAGMGGSSLAPEVITRTAGVDLTILDSTDPHQVGAALADRIERTVLVVASKSGSTVETDSHRRAYEQAFRDAGLTDAEVAEHIVVVTDPGSPLHREADEAGYDVVLADPDVGGRYSALSAFGLTPSHLAGADVQRLLADARVLAGELGDRRQPRRPARPGPRQRRQGRARQAGAGRRRVRHRRASATGPSSSWPSRPASRAPASCPSSSRASTRPASPTPARTRYRVVLGPGRPGLEAAAGQRVARRAVPALGVRHRGRRHGARHQPVRPAERRGVEGEHQQDPRRVRRRAAARGRPGPGGRRRRGARRPRRTRRARPTSPACWAGCAAWSPSDGYLAVMAYLDRHGDGDAARCPAAARRAASTGVR